MTILAAGFYATILGSVVVIGPAILMSIILPYFVSLLFLLVTVILLVVRFVVRPNRLRRFLPLVATSLCLAFFVFKPISLSDAHLALQIYLSGGPDRLNDWAQEMLQAGVKTGGLDYLSDDHVPTGIRNHLSRRITVSDTHVVFEYGGGFQLYGIIIRMRNPNIKSRQFWVERLVGWPREIDFYSD